MTPASPKAIISAYPSPLKSPTLRSCLVLFQPLAKSWVLTNCDLNLLFTGSAYATYVFSAPNPIISA